MAERYGRPFVYVKPQQRFLTDSPTLSVALKELSRVLYYSDLIACNLSTSGLTLELARELPQHSKQLKRLYALDLSSNYITATQWQDVYDLAATFLLNGDLVQFLDLGQNYLPQLQSVVEDLAVFEKFKVFGSRLGLGMGGTPCTGNKGIDYWILKRRVYELYTELDANMTAPSRGYALLASGIAICGTWPK